MNQSISKIIGKKIVGELTEEEEKQLSIWLNKPDNKKLYEHITSTSNVKSIIENRQIIKDSSPLTFDQIKSKYRRIRIFSFTKYAAVFAIIICSVCFIFISKDRQSKEIATVSKSETPKAPVITLFNGKKIFLDSIRNNAINLSENIQVNKSKRELVCNSDNENQAQIRYNTIEIPRGSEYNVTLPDNSKVIINSESKLSWPAKFSNNSRVVKLQGQAIFEVTKDKNRPFYVQCKNLKVKVLGTVFDVESYENDDKVSTTLLEGKVEVYTYGMQKVSLKPNQQMTYDKIHRSINIVNVDASEVLVWRNGLFKFRDMSLQDIMNKLSRWYDIEVYFESKDIRDYKYGLILHKYEPVESVIKAIESHGEVKITKNKKVIIFKKA